MQEVSGGVVVDGLALGAGSVGQVLGLRIKVVSSLNKARTETGFVVQCSPAQHFFFQTDREVISSRATKMQMLTFHSSLFALLTYDVG